MQWKYIRKFMFTKSQISKVYVTSSLFQNIKECLNKITNHADLASMSDSLRTEWEDTVSLSLPDASPPLTITFAFGSIVPVLIHPHSHLTVFVCCKLKQ